MRKKNKTKNIRELFTDHIDKVTETIKNMKQTIELYVSGEYRDAREYSFRTHEAEGNADRIRRKTIETIYSGSSMPLVMKDLIHYLAKQDKIADRAESACDFIITQRPMIPEEYKADIKQLLDMAARSIAPLKDAMTAFFTDFSKVSPSIIKIKDCEEKEDKIEWDLTRKIYSDSNLELAQKIHLNELVFHIATISDVIEDAADTLDSVVVKKKI